MREWWELRPTAFINFLIFIIMNELKFNPAVTAIRRKTLSAPIAWLIQHHYLSSGQSKILDYGCGYGSDVRLLREWNKDLYVEGYDPYYNRIDLGDTFYDVVLCTFVLNVVNVDEQNDILKKIWRQLKANGQLFITVRRDVAPGTTRFERSNGTYHIQRFVELDLKYFKVLYSNSKFAIYYVNERNLLLYLDNMDLLGIDEEG